MQSTGIATVCSLRTFPSSSACGTTGIRHTRHPGEPLVDPGLRGVGYVATGVPAVLVWGAFTRSEFWWAEVEKAGNYIDGKGTDQPGAWLSLSNGVHGTTPV